MGVAGAALRGPPTVRLGKQQRFSGLASQSDARYLLTFLLQRNPATAACTPKGYTHRVVQAILVGTVEPLRPRNWPTSQRILPFAAVSAAPRSRIVRCNSTICAPSLPSARGDVCLDLSKT